MAIDNATFVERFPEFAEIDTSYPAQVTARLDAAKHFVSASLWGSRYEDGVFYKAAHLLAMSPLGENARLESGVDTTYDVVFRSMLLSLPVRGLVSGSGC
jgi:hypothetical protein